MKEFKDSEDNIWDWSEKTKRYIKRQGQKRQGQED